MNKKTTVKLKLNSIYLKKYAFLLLIPYLLFSLVLFNIPLATGYPLKINSPKIFQNYFPLSPLTLSKQNNVFAGLWPFPGPPSAAQDNLLFIMDNETGSVSGSILCPECGPGDIQIYALDGPLEQATQVFGQVVVSPPWQYTIENLPLDTGIWLLAWWSKNQFNDSPGCEDYLGLYEGNPISFSAALPDLTTVDLTLSAIEICTTISGTVSSSSGLPLSGATVQLIGADDEYVYGETLTDDAGSYAICKSEIEFMPGSYKLKAVAPGYCGSYWENNTINFNNATVIDIACGSNLYDYDFTLGQGGSISGVITREEDGQPLEGIAVQVYQNKCWDTYLGEAITDDSGFYQFDCLPSGEVHVISCAKCRGVPYVDTWWDGAGGDIDCNAAEGVAVTAGGETTDIDFSLQQGGIISGQVTDESNNPLPDVCVDATDHECGGNWYGSSTDADGNYSIVVPPGSFYVRTNPPCHNFDYTVEWWSSLGGTAICYDATAVIVTAGEESPDIDFSLDEGGMIAGRVMTQDEQPIAGIWINALDFTTGTWVNGAMTGDNGTYFIRGLTPGSYRAEAVTDGTDYIREFYDDTRDYNSAAEIAVAAGATAEDIDFTLTAGGSISGFVTRESNGQSVADIWMVAYDFTSGEYAGAAQTEPPDGSYSIRGLPEGIYRVQADTYNTDYISQYYYNVSDYNDAASVSVTQYEDTSNINFVLVSRGTIYENTAWTRDNSPYIISHDLLIASGATLTIEDGVEVRFAADEDGGNLGDYTDQTEILVEGRLEVLGTAADPVVFTSAADAPNAGDWGQIKVRNGGTAELQNCRIRYAIRGVYVNNTLVNMSDSVVEDCSDTGIYLYGEEADGVIERVTVQRCNYGVRVERGSDAVLRQVETRESGSFGLVASGAGILIEGCSFRESNTTFAAVQVSSSQSQPEIPAGIRDSEIVCTGSGDGLRYNNANMYAGPLEIEGCTISGGGAYGGVRLFNYAAIDISWSDLSGSSGYGIYNQSPRNQECRFNYWGTAATEEMNAGGNPKNISAIYDQFDNSPYGAVDYSGWLDVPGGTPAPHNAPGYVTFTDEGGNGVTYYTGAEAFIQVGDDDLNTDPVAAEEVTVAVFSSTQNDAEMVTLTETGPDTGEFRGSIAFDAASGTGAADGDLDVMPGDTLRARYEEAADGFGNPVVREAGALYAGDRPLITGEITESTTWTSVGSPYLVSGDILIASGATLTIEEGVEVKLLTFESGANLGSYAGKIELLVNGRLEAMGTSAAPVMFTSAVEAPAAGDWGGIQIRNGGTAELRNCQLRYAIVGVYTNRTRVNIYDSIVEECSDTGIYLYGEEAGGVIEGVTVQRCANYGVRVYNGSTAELRNCQIRYATTGVYANNTLVNMSDSVVEDCSDTGIYLYGEEADGVIERVTVQRCKYGIEASYGSDAVLREVVTQDNRSYGLYVGGAGILVEGCSFRESNAAVYIYNYGGNYYFEAPEILDSELVSTGSAGLYFQSNNQYAEPLVIERCRISGGFYGVYLSSYATVDISWSDLSGSGTWGVYNPSYRYQECRFNYWGEGATGEMESGGNPKNIGYIYDWFDQNNWGAVDYSGWLDGPGGTPAPHTNLGHIAFIDADGNGVAFYTGPEAFIQVGDDDLNTDPEAAEEVTVEVFSSTQAEPEMVALTETGPDTGEFRGSIAFDAASGTGAADGDLDVMPGDTLRARYEDAADNWGNPAVQEATTIYAGDGHVIQPGNITESTTWTSVNSPYIVTGDILIASGATLTIEAGVELKFLANQDHGNLGDYFNQIELLVEGRLEALGTAANPVVFTSVSETPAAGDWGQVKVRNGGTAELQNCQIRYAIYGVYAYNTLVNISDSEIEDCSQWGIYLSGEAADGIVQRVTVQRCYYGIFAENGSDAVLRQVGTRENKYKGLEISDAGILVEGCSFRESFTHAIRIYYDDISDEIPVGIYNSDIFSTGYSYGLYFIGYNQYTLPMAIDGCTIRGGEYSVFLYSNAAVNISNCNLSGSRWYGVYNASASNQECRFNYWGDDATEEMESGGNPKNIGYIYDWFDRSYGMVNYSDWLDEPVNGRPWAWPVSATTSSGNSTSIALDGTDPDGDNLTYAVDTLPSHGSIYIAGSIATYTPDSDFVGNDAFTYTASDGLLTSFPAVVRVHVVSGAAGLVLNPIGNKEGAEGSELRFAVSGTAPGGNVPALKAQNLPNGAAFNDAGDGTGEFIWTPNYEQAGSYTVTFTASYQNLSDSETIIINIQDTVSPDTDVDGLPDYWEEWNFGTLDQTAADDPDNDGYANGYEFNGGSNPNDPNSIPAPTMFVDAAESAGGDGSEGFPFNTIQQALNAASEYTVIEVAEDTYTGSGNTDLDFLGKPVYLRAASYPGTCIIDSEGTARAFYFHQGEEKTSAVDGFTIINGSAEEGGAIACQFSNPAIRRCILQGNQSQSFGGAISCRSASPVIVSCILTENQAQTTGGAIGCIGQSNPVIVYSTISANTAVQAGGALSGADGAAVQLTNSILWNNSAPIGHEISLTGEGSSISTITVSYSDVQGGEDEIDLEGGSTVQWGDGNLNVNPFFVESNPPTYHLAPTSPCIDAGAEAAFPGPDIDGESRPQKSGWDMGADEYSGPNISFIRIQDAQSGGNIVNSLSVVKNTTLTLWAIAYEDYPYYEPILIGPVPVNWSGTGICQGRLTTLTGSSTSFTATELGTGSIRADTTVLAGSPDATTGTIRVLPAADLIVTDIQAPSGAQSGQRIQISWTITNQGSDDLSGSWSDSIYLSSDNQWGDDTHLGNLYYSAALPEGGSIQRTTQVRVPDGLEGDFYIIIATDSGNSINEFTGEQNNILVDDQALHVSLSSYPDLVVTDISVPEEIFSGQQIDVSWTITNNGSGDLIDDGYSDKIDKIYLSSDNQPGDDILLGQFSFYGNLASGQSLQRIQQVQIPDGLEGNFYIIIVTDALNYIYEYNGEQNNTAVDDRQIHIILADYPDLQVSSINAPPEAWSGQDISISWVVANAGTGATDAPYWHDTVYLSLDANFDASDIVLGEFINESYLNAGESYSSTHSVQLPLGLSGQYYIIVVTDSRNNVFELDEENNKNVSTSPVVITYVPQPNCYLQVTSVNAPDSAWAGASIPITYTITNNGDAPIHSINGSWDNAIFISPDPEYDQSSDIALDWHIDKPGNLNPGESYTNTYSVTIPTNLASGTYYIIVLPDPPMWTDCAKSTGSTPVQVMMANPADLEVTAINPAQTVYFSGQPITLEWTVINNGPGPTIASSWTDSVFLSSDTIVVPTSDILLGKAGHSGFLDVDASYASNTSLVLPNGISGNYYICVSADSGNNVAEGAWEDNNTLCSASPVQINLTPPPNLRVTAIAAPATATAGQTVTVLWTVNNTGTGSTAVSSWNDKVYLSSDTVFSTATDTLLGTVSHSGVLAVQGTYTTSKDVTIPANVSSSGTYYLFVVTDSDNKVYEHNNENDNTNYSPVRISIISVTTTTTIAADPPDLHVDTVEAPETATSGKTITVTWRVNNAGPGPAVEQYWTDAVYLSADNQLNTASDISLGSFGHIGRLEAGTGYDQSQVVTIPNGMSGDYYLFVFTDSYNQVGESASENNNTGFAAVPIRISLTAPADLIVTSVSAPDTAYSGQPLQVSWSVLNNGSGDTNVSQWTDSIYLSKDLIVDTQYDHSISYQYHDGSLATGESYTGTASVTIPQGVSGRYYVLVFTDRTNKVYEHNAEHNNTGYKVRTIDIVLAPPADLIVTDVVVPSSGSPGQPATISWTVTNEGTNTASGEWTDTLYLSADQSWDINDEPITSKVHSGTVAAGAAYTETVSVDLPGVLPGEYHVIVRTDIRNNVRESNESNNAMASSSKIALDAIALTPNVPFEAQLLSGTKHYYKVQVQEGQDLRIKLDSQSATSANELYVSFNKMPNQRAFEYLYSAPFEPDQNLNIPFKGAGIYYILVRGGSVPDAPAPYTITANIFDFSILGVSPARGGNVGNLTMEISGARFVPGISAELVNTDGQSVSASRIFYADSTTVYATFDLTGLVPGLYDVRLARPDGSTCMSEDSFEVVLGRGPQLVTRLVGPSALRPNTYFTVWLEYTNAGDVDMISPLLTISSPTNTPIALYPDEGLKAGSIQVLGTSFNGPAGVLRPGTSQSIPLYSNSGTNPWRFNLGIQRANNTPIEDWNAVEQRVKPADADPETWPAIWSAFRSRMGTTWKDYLSVLAEDATLINNYFGDLIYSVDALFQFEFEMAMNQGNTQQALVSMKTTMNQKQIKTKRGSTTPVRIYKRK